MSTEQPTQDETAQKGALLLRTADDDVYAIPQDALDAFRLSDEQRADLEARLPDEQRDALQKELPTADDDVQGYEQYIGVFNPGPYRWVAFTWEWTNRWYPDTSYYPPLH